MNVLNRNAGNLTFLEVQEILNKSPSKDLVTLEEWPDEIVKIQQKLANLGDVLPVKGGARMARSVKYEDESKVFDLRVELSNLKSLKQSCFIKTKTLEYLNPRLENQSFESISNFRKDLHDILPNVTLQQELQLINLRPTTTAEAELMINRMGGDVPKEKLESIIASIQTHCPPPERVVESDDDSDDSDDDNNDDDNDDNNDDSTEDEMQNGH